MRFRLLFPVSFVGLIICTAVQALGVLPTTTGKEWRLWTEGHFSVIVAKVKSIELDPKPNGLTHKSVLVPLATLAGSLDSTATPDLEMRLAAGLFGTSIKSPPPANSIVLVVVQSPGDIVPDICTFMPDNSALVVISGLNDPRVTETIERIRQARAHPNPSPYPPPTNAPTTVNKP